LSALRQQGEQGVNAPIFIGGAGRSGTTLLRVMLNAHPRLCSGPEFKLLPQAIELYRETLAQKEILKSYFLEQRDVDEMFSRLIQSFFENFRSNAHASRMVEKTPHNVLIMRELASIMPDARFIHVIRDGRDVACSLLKMKWYGPDGKLVWYVSDLGNAAKYWVEVVTKGLEDAQHPSLRGKVTALRYEDLVADPAQAMKDVLAFLDEPWSDAVLEHARVARGYEPRESSTDQVSRQIYSSSVGRWRKEFSEDDVEEFREIAGDLLLRLGYQNR
jgi:protein-tyrosine sulfotransferase